MKKVLIFIVIALLCAACVPQERYEEALLDITRLTREKKELKAENEELATRVAELESNAALGYAIIMDGETSEEWMGRKVLESGDVYDELARAVGEKYNVHENHTLSITAKTLVIDVSNEDAVFVAEQLGRYCLGIVSQYDSVMISSGSGVIFLKMDGYGVKTTCFDYTDTDSLENEYWANEFFASHDLLK